MIEHGRRVALGLHAHERPVEDMGGSPFGLVVGGRGDQRLPQLDFSQQLEPAPRLQPGSPAR